MDKDFLKEVFSRNTGNVYRWHGTVPDGQDPMHWITGKLVTAIGDNTFDTTVVDLGDRGGWVIYIDSAIELDDSEFSFICDLIPPEFEGPQDPINGEDSTQINPPIEGQ